VPVDRLDG